MISTKPKKDKDWLFAAFENSSLPPTKTRQTRVFTNQTDNWTNRTKTRYPPPPPPKKKNTTDYLALRCGRFSVASRRIGIRDTLAPAFSSPQATTVPSWRSAAKAPFVAWRSSKRKKSGQAGSLFLRCSTWLLLQGPPAKKVKNFFGGVSGKRFFISQKVKVERSNPIAVGSQCPGDFPILNPIPMLSTRCSKRKKPAGSSSEVL